MSQKPNMLSTTVPWNRVADGYVETTMQMQAQYAEEAIAASRLIRIATPEAVAEDGLNAFVQDKSYLAHGCTNYLTSLLPRILSRAAVIKIVANMFKNKVAPLPA